MSVIHARVKVLTICVVFVYALFYGWEFWPCPSAYT